MGLFERMIGALRSAPAEAPVEKPGRNEPCWCGSGRKYKKCHLAEDEKKAAEIRALNCGPT